ncbi:MAG TPA: hypothetical protein VFP40_08380 [Terriglobales bacterium]|nr:hypothetical protein [Terriglobales bacterium]
MSAKRVILAGILGAIAMFLWSAVAHIVTPLGETGISEIPNEPSVLTAMQSSLGANHGMFLFPGMGLGPNATREQKSQAMQQYQAKLDSNPSGILIYHPAGAKGMTGSKLAIEFLTEVLEALIVAFLIAGSRATTLGGRAAIGLMVGIAAAVTTNISYWNWYGFPTNYTVAYMSIEIVAFLLAGVVAGVVLGRGVTNRSVAATA